MINVFLGFLEILNLKMAVSYFFQCFRKFARKPKSKVVVGSVVGFRRNFAVESKIELNLLEGLLLRKRPRVDIPDRL